jgi:hypothetical protein
LLQSNFDNLLARMRRVFGSVGTNPSDPLPRVIHPLISCQARIASGAPPDMNMSLADIYRTLTQIDWPSLSAVWQWFITAPWWLAIGSALIAYFAGKLLIAVSSALFHRACDAAERLGEMYSEWSHRVRYYFAAFLNSKRLLKLRLRELFGFEIQSDKSVNRKL